MSDVSPGVRATSLTTVQWLVCATAAVGFAFDSYELLILPLILPPALADLGGLRLGDIEFARWRDLMFYGPAVAGGVFGLLGGYLTDRLGRRRVLFWSILLYACAAGASAFATSLPMLFVLRCATFVGVCVEFAAATAWLAELFPEPRQGDAVLGYTQAFSSLGGLMVGAVFALASRYGAELPAIRGGHDAWRYTLISALIPAFFLMAVRPFLPESYEWERKRAAGTLQRPRIMELFVRQYRRTTLVSALIFSCGIGAAIALQQLPQIIPGIADVALLPGPERQQIVGEVQVIQELGGFAGRTALAALAVRLGSNPAILRLFLTPALVVVPFVFLYPAQHVSVIKCGVFVAGFLLIGQLSFWGNYLPRMYPIHLRGTGESFAANVGGRMIGASAALAISQLSYVVPGVTPTLRLSRAAAGVSGLVCAAGLIASFFLIRPRQALQPDTRST